MKILQIVIGLASGGAERLVVDLSNELSKNNEVTLLMIKDSSIENFSFYLPELSNTIKYINAGVMKGLSIKKAILIYKIIKVANPDIVHLHLPKTPIYVLPSILLNRKVKFIETIHSQADKLGISSFGHKIKYFLFKTKLLTPCTISDKNKELFEKFYKLDNVPLIYNGRSKPIKTELYLEVQKEVRNLKISEYDITFLHIGRCMLVKNQLLLINVFNRLHTEGIACQLLIIGDKFDNALGISLKKVAGKNIHFLDQKNNIADYFFASDAFCLSSLYEGMPISLIESFACGCIPISTPVSGSIDLIQNGINGYISKRIGEDDYYLSVKEFLINREKIDIENLINLYTEKFSIEMCAKNYLSLFSLLKKIH